MSESETAAPRTSPAPARHQESQPDVLSDILREVEERTQESAPRTLARMTLESGRETAQWLEDVQRASIKLTKPEDWVAFKTKDGATVCFLQDVGCQRLRSLWQISFDDVRLSRDLASETLPDGHYTAEIIVCGRSSLTGEKTEEIGFRSSSGFFGKEWEKVTSEESDVEIARMKANVRKAALANGRGRCIRTLTGMGQMPIDVLKDIFGDAVTRVRSTEFQAGTKGGSGTGASEPQCKAIVGEALRKVAGIDKLFDWDHLMKKVVEAKLSGGRQGKASQIIERLKTAEAGGVTIQQFEKALGVQLYSEPGGEE